MKIYVCLLLLVFTSCKTVSKIEIKSYPSDDYEVIAWYDEEKKDIWAVSFPFVLIIKNTRKKEELTFHQYIYEKPSEGAFAFLYKEGDNNALKKLSSTLKKEILPNETKKYIIYSKHLINKSIYSDEILTAYQAREFNNNSIPLSSFRKFRKSLPKLTQNLLSNDSIFLKFTNFDKKNNQPKRIKIPIDITDF